MYVTKPYAQQSQLSGELGMSNLGMRLGVTSLGPGNGTREAGNVLKLDTLLH